MTRILKKSTKSGNLFWLMNHLKLQCNETSHLVAREMFPQEEWTGPFTDPRSVLKRKRNFFPWELRASFIVVDSIALTSWDKKHSQLNTRFVDHVRYNLSGT